MLNFGYVFAFQYWYWLFFVSDIPGQLEVQHCVKLSTKGGESHHFGGVLTSRKKYRAIWGIGCDSIAISRDMRRLSADNPLTKDNHDMLLLLHHP